MFPVVVQWWRVGSFSLISWKKYEFHYINLSKLYTIFDQLVIRIRLLTLVWLLVFFRDARKFKYQCSNSNVLHNNCINLRSKDITSENIPFTKAINLMRDTSKKYHSVGMLTFFVLISAWTDADYSTNMKGIFSCFNKVSPTTFWGRKILLQ